MRIVLFSGLGADERFFSKLRLSDIAVTCPRHIEPQHREPMSDYALRAAEAARIGADDILGGSSFGGMVAAQIAASRPVRGLILLGSGLGRDAIPTWYRWIELASRAIPMTILRWSRMTDPMLRWRFGVVSINDRQLLTDMMRECSAVAIRRAAWMLVRWPGVHRPPCPILHIHGALDRILPANRVRPDVLLDDAGHVFPLTHPEETARWISPFVSSLSAP